MPQLDAAAVTGFLNGIRAVTNMLFGTVITHVSVELDRNFDGEEDSSHLDTVTETALLCMREPVEMEEWLSLFGQEEIADWKITINHEYLTENNIAVVGTDDVTGKTALQYGDRIVLNGTDYTILKIIPTADWVGNIVLVVLFIKKQRFGVEEE